MHRTVLCSMLLVIALTACDQKPTSVKTMPPAIRKYAQATLLEGAVSNNKGVIKTGTVAVTDENGRSIVHAPVENGQFKVEIPAGTVLPILLNFSTEENAEKLTAVVIYDTVTRYYINPTSTAIAKAAKTFGGYTRANLDRAAETTVHVPDSNKTTAGWKGDPTKQYGGWH